MKDCNGHVYSIPLYSTPQLGLIQEYTLASADKHAKTATLPKMTKVADIMQMKVVNT